MEDYETAILVAKAERKCFGVLEDSRTLAAV
jgi:hypothetical protein